MKIPVIVLLTKIDRCPDHVFQETTRELVGMLKSRDMGQRPFLVKDKKDVEMVENKMTYLVPMFPISCITGHGLGLLRMLLTQLPQRRRHAKKHIDKPFEYLAEDIFQVRGVGTVISGFVNRGSWEKGEPIYLGPLKDGTVMQVVPKSTHVAQTNVDRAWAGHQVCFALPKLPQVRRKLLGKGMIAMKRSFSPCRKFVADIVLTKGATVTVQSGKFDATLHVLHMKQNAKVVDIQVDCKRQQVIRQGDTARVTFEFSHKLSYLRPGMRLILRIGHVIGYGVVKAAL
jgi:GTPase